VRDRVQKKKDLGVAQADTIRAGEGAHWKRRYYSEKFAVVQEDLVDFLMRIRKAYIEGLCWVLKYYYQGVCSWTWFYPYHYAPFGSDLIGIFLNWFVYLDSILGALLFTFKLCYSHILATNSLQITKFKSEITNDESPSQMLSLKNLSI